MKRVLSFILMLFAMVGSVCHAEGIGVVIDDEIINFDVSPIIENGRTLVPMRKIFEELGCEVEWLSESRTVIATKNSKIIALQIGKNKIISTDIETGVSTVTETDTAPKIHNGRTLVPVRVISESLGCIVEWDGENQTVIIKNDMQ